MTMNIVNLALVYFFLPETKNVPLEQMDTLFGDVDHSAKGADLIEKEDDVQLESINIDKNLEGNRTQVEGNVKPKEVV